HSCPADKRPTLPGSQPSLAVGVSFHTGLSPDPHRTKRIILGVRGPDEGRYFLGAQSPWVSWTWSPMSTPSCVSSALTRFHRRWAPPGLVTTAKGRLWWKFFTQGARASTSIRTAWWPAHVCKKGGPCGVRS